MSSLRDRLSLALSLVLVAAGLLLALALQAFPRALVEDYVRARLDHDADLLYVRVREAPDHGTAARIAREAAGTAYSLPLSGHYFELVRDGPAIRSRSLWDEDLPRLDGELPADADGTASTLVRRAPGPAGQSLLVLRRRYPGAGGDWTVMVAEDVSALDAEIARFQRWLLVGGAAALVALLLLQRRLVVRGLAALDSAVAACQRLERGETTSIEVAGPDELRPMLEAVNRLAAHQAGRMARIRHAAGNLSHALKTPLAVLEQSAAEAASQGNAPLAATLRAQVAAMRAPIERELRRARVTAGGPPTESFHARTQLAGLAAALHRLHRDRPLDIEIDAPARTWPFDREDMLELFGNLLDNACKWARSRVRARLVDEMHHGSAPHGPCDLRGVGDAAARLVFTVDDDGPGVPEALLGRLGTAGLRADESRPGHGLGLAIVGDIVRQYGGTIRYGRSAEFGGLHVEVRIP